MAEIITVNSLREKIVKGCDLLRQHGFLGFIKKFLFRILYLSPSGKPFIELLIFRDGLERRFTLIHRFNYWNNFESPSGGGLTENVTQNLLEKCLTCSINLGLNFFVMPLVEIFPGCSTSSR